MGNTAVANDVTEPDRPPKPTQEVAVDERQLRWALRRVGTVARRSSDHGVAVTADGDKFKIRAFDGDFFIEATVDVVDGRLPTVGVKHASLTRLANAAPGPLRLHVIDDRLHANSVGGRFALNMPARPVEEVAVPPLPTIPADATVWRLTAEDLAAVRRVARFASRDDHRPIITGVYFDGENVVATDSYRLAVYSLPLTIPEHSTSGVLLPAQLFEMLPDPPLDSTVDVYVFADGKYEAAACSIDGVTIVAREIQGEFPNYRGLLPSTWIGTVTVNRAAFLDAVGRLGGCVGDAAPLRLRLLPDRIALSGADIGEGLQFSDEVDATHDRPEVTIAFNPTYLKEAVRAGTDPDLTLNYIDVLKPVIFDPDTNGVRLLLMPVRVH